MQNIELRSDTFTRPTPAMLEAMLRAEVGDDVFQEDPTVNRLESEIASYFGMEAALFCPSGTMSNQIAIRCHTQPGDEVICEQSSHVYLYEGGGIAVNSLCQVKLLQGDRGRITASQIEQSINPDDIHRPVSRLVSLENTANRGGGSCYDWKEILAIHDLCKSNNLRLHLDGARVWNAIVAGNEDPKEYGRLFDSLSVCMSKGMGAPVGSLVVGRRDFIQQARRVRKVLGGGMRQAGYLASAGLYALQHHLPLLRQDHLHAKQVAEVLKEKNWIGELQPVETNILIFSLRSGSTPQDFIQYMKQFGVQCMAISSHQVRMVFHLDVTTPMVDKVCEIIREKEQ